MRRIFLLGLAVAVGDNLAVCETGLKLINVRFYCSACRIWVQYGIVTVCLWSRICNSELVSVFLFKLLLRLTLAVAVGCDDFYCRWFSILIAVDLFLHVLLPYYYCCCSLSNFDHTWD